MKRIIRVVLIAYVSLALFFIASSVSHMLPLGNSQCVQRVKVGDSYENSQYDCTLGDVVKNLGYAAAIVSVPFVVGMLVVKGLSPKDEQKLKSGASGKTKI